MYQNNGTVYCEGCYDRAFSSCEECGGDTRREDMVIGYARPGRTREYCQPCIENAFLGCGECGEYYAARHFSLTHDVCEDCHNEDTCGECADERDEQAIQNEREADAI